MGDLVDEALWEEISDAVEARREAAARLLGGLVRVPSVTGSEGAVQEVVAEEMGARGLAVERFEATAEGVAPYREHVGEQTAEDLLGRPNVVGRRSGSGGGRSLLLNAHVDTVEPGDTALWRARGGPFSGAVEGDLLYGLGACDMKGGLATQLVALDALGDLGVELGGDVAVSAVVGEETSGVGALATVLAGYRADAVVISEPTRLALVPAQGGGLVLRIKVPGRAVQAAEPHRGVSAFEKFLPIYGELKALERERNAALRHPLYDHLQNKAPINFGVVRSGDWAVTVPGYAVAEVRVGLLPGEELGPSRAMVLDRIFSAAGRDPWLREYPPEVRFFGGQSAPSEVAPDAPICTAVARAHERATGTQPAVEGVAYGADMRIFDRVGGMPCVLYGAGDIGWAHRAEERVSITELLTAAKTLANLLCDWCGVAARTRRRRSLGG